MIERFLIVWLTLSSLAAYCWPDIAEALGTSLSSDPFIASRAYLSHLIAVTMLAVGSLLPSDEIQQLGRRWHSVLLGTCTQYIAMPTLAYVVGNAMGFEPPLLIGIIVVGCVPGAMASNVLTLVARGNVSYSVSLTTLATLVSPLVVPFFLYLFLQEHVDKAILWEGCKTLALTVVLPVVLGHLLSRRLNWWKERSQVWGPLVANIAILWIIAVVVGLNRDRMEQISLNLLTALLLINGLGYTAGYWTGAAFRMPEPMRRALTIEVGMQNAGVGTMLTLQLFPDSPEAAIPTTLYTFGCMFTGAALAQYWRIIGLPAEQETDAEVSDENEPQ